SSTTRPDGARILVPAVTLDLLWDRLGRPPFSLVADIEGTEAILLERESECLAHCQSLIIELHATWDAAGSPLSVNQLADGIRGRHGLRQLARRGNVFAFARS
ncbi:MAG TPA: hypothetical protein VIY86_04350, partial [Pirellulaceae bacterium]